ncbi:hypothetical protein AB0469_36315 [Streptomyces sp. NPDC093801]|uniref:hypothetical protein n=1 Tax=Streptomyces sp. NPDC093801 TaxID=3155203 RepID=UPI00344FB651
MTGRTPDTAWRGSRRCRRPSGRCATCSSTAFVTLHTARALLRRKDRAGLSVVASALAEAGPNHGDWIDTASFDVFGVFSDDLDEALRLCEELMRDTDAPLALGARRLHEVLREIDPLVRPTRYEQGSSGPR